MEIHTVAPGETVSSIAALYGVSPELIISQNELSDPDVLAVGQTLVILFPSQLHTVTEGETLTSIANLYGTTKTVLWRNNPSLRGSSYIYPGQTLVVSYAANKLGTLSTNGYAYPFIDREVLRKTLPYLTYITVFSYGFRPDGSLVVPDDEEILRIVRGYDAAPVLLLSTLGDDGKFSNELAATLLASEGLQNRLISDLIDVMDEKGYRGIDVDFEYLNADDAQRYVAFMQKLTAEMNEAGFFTAVSLAPKTSADQPGQLYEGHDYAGLGAAADKSLLMTYEWGYT